MYSTTTANRIGFFSTFHHYQYIFRWLSESVDVLWVYNLIRAETYLIWEKYKTCSVGRNVWVCWKALAYWLPFCPSWPVIKMDRFLSMWNTECLHELLLDKNLRHSHVSGYGPDWLFRIVVYHYQDYINKFDSSFLIRTIRVGLPSCLTFVITCGLIQTFSSPLYCPHIETLKSSYRSLRVNANSTAGCF